jgi:hypothetical protein
MAFTRRFRKLGLTDEETLAASPEDLTAILRGRFGDPPEPVSTPEPLADKILRQGHSSSAV